MARAKKTPYTPCPSEALLASLCGAGHTDIVVHFPDDSPQRTVLTHLAIVLTAHASLPCPHGDTTAPLLDHSLHVASETLHSARATGIPRIAPYAVLAGLAHDIGGIPEVQNGHNAPTARISALFLQSLPGTVHLQYFQELVQAVATYQGANPRGGVIGQILSRGHRNAASRDRIGKGWGSQRGATP